MRKIRAGPRAHRNPTRSAPKFACEGAYLSIVQPRWAMISQAGAAVDRLRQRGHERIREILETAIMRHLATITVLVMTTLAGCATGFAGDLKACATPTSRVELRTFSRPACPGPRRAGSHCSPRPLAQARVVLLSADGSAVVATARSDARGRLAFTLCLKGRETFRVHALPFDGNGLPRPPRNRTITLRPAQSKTIHLLYDSGLR